jgi:hypothetical protein
MRPSTQGVYGLPGKWVCREDIWLNSHKWFKYWPCVWDGDLDEHRGAITYDFFHLRLPSWGMLYDIRCDEYRWGQRVLFWHGRKGFRMGVYFPP